MNVIEKLATYEDQISPGVSACVGCNVELTLRTCMKVLGPNTIFAVPPGCMGGVGVVGWDKESGAKTPVFFPLLDNVASMLAGIKMHYERIGRKVNVVAFAGDGASVDAGMQCLSGAAERGDDGVAVVADRFLFGDDDARRVDPGFSDFSFRPVPDTVPPVPTQATNTSSCPSVSSIISTAVVCSCAIGLAALANCCKIIAPGIEAHSSSARAIAPFIPKAPGVSSSWAP